jgi:cell division septum initiation protein DivIVA
MSAEKSIKNIFDNIKEEVSEGAATLGEESSKIYQQVKVKAKELFDSGSEAVDHVSDRVREYIEKYQNEQKIKELEFQKKTLNAQLGDQVFHEFQKNGTVSKRYMTTNKMTELLNSITQTEKEIEELGKELDAK